uniref:Uncharacterized protein n=1 Tax=Sparus aurata TaxID=8175 RepID=A0A671UN96_SPAAU
PQIPIPLCCLRQTVMTCSKDLQLPRIFTGISEDSDERVRFDDGDLSTQRELVSLQVSGDLAEMASTFGLILEDVSLIQLKKAEQQKLATIISAEWDSETASNTLMETGDSLVKLQKALNVWNISASS